MHRITPQRDRWSVSIIALHWATVACVVILVDTGWQVRALMGDLAPRNAVLRLHASLGIVLLVVTIVRVLTRLVTEGPPTPTSGRLRRIFATVVQVALYLTLLGLIATGVVTAAPRPFMPAVQLFGVWPLPKITGIPPELMRSLPRVHATLVWVLLGLVAVHVAAAIYGTFIRGDRTILRMLPWSWRQGQRLGRKTQAMAPRASASRTPPPAADERRAKGL